MRGERVRDTGEYGPCEAAWRDHYASFEAAGLPCPRLLVPGDELPTLALPAGLPPRCREAAYGAAIAELFVALYGPRMLSAAIGAWDRIVVKVAAGADEEYATD